METANDIDERIVGASLKIFRKTLRDNSESQWSDTSGSPPSYGFVALREHRKREQPYSAEVPMRQWRITFDDADEMEPNPADFIPEFGASQFFDRFLGWFEVTPKQDQFEIGWQTGPRFGRGFAYDIELYEGTGFRLGNPRNTWAS